MSTDWKQYWENRSAADLSDFAVDRGGAPRTPDLEQLANQELIEFISPKQSDLVLDAGCGTGGTSLLLSAHVWRIVAFDYAENAIGRARGRLRGSRAANVRMLRASVVDIPLPGGSVDRVVCASVLQYLGDEDTRRAFHEFRRVLKPSGELILHVKNRSSVYSLSLLAAKRLLAFVGKHTARPYHMRPFSWYIRELSAAGFDVRRYNSFNLLILDRMPHRILSCLQRIELRQRNRFPFATRFARRHGFDLKLSSVPVGSVNTTQTAAGCQ